MKKNLLIIMSFFSILLAWCSDSDISNINPEEWNAQNWISVEEFFDNQIENSQYIKDFEDFISYNVLLITEDKPYTSDSYFNAKFDKSSSLQWWVDFSQKKISKNHNSALSDIEFVVKAENLEDNSSPFDLSWNLSLLFKDDELYANIHDLGVFMWEWNATAKMYTLLWNMVIDKWVNLEAHSGWIVEMDENEDKRLPYIVWTFKNVLKSEWINEDSPNFLGWIARLIDAVNSYIDLWISTNELKMVNHEISYSELWNKSIQKEFTWSFQWKQSAFDLSFVASQEWIEIHLYNIKIKEYDADLDYNDTDTEFMFSLKEDKKSEYSVNFESTKMQQKVVDLDWKIKYDDIVRYSADFIMQPLELVDWQKISWKLEWNITKKSWESDKQIPEITGEVLSLTELLSSL